MNALKGAIAGQCAALGVPFSDIARAIGKSERQARRLIADRSIKLSDLRIIADILDFSDEQAKEIIK